MFCASLFVPVQFILYLYDLRDTATSEHRFQLQVQATCVQSNLIELFLSRLEKSEAPSHCLLAKITNDVDVSQQRGVILAKVRCLCHLVEVF